jgi:hypothetical protein
VPSFLASNSERFDLQTPPLQRRQARHSRVTLDVPSNDDVAQAGTSGRMLAPRPSAARTARLKRQDGTE